MSDNNPHSICNHTKKNIDQLFKGVKRHTFCEKCGTIIFKDHKGNLHFTLKPRSKQKKVDFDPVELINEMIKRESIHYPNLNNNYNMSEEEKSSESIKKSISIYLEKRKTILYYLQKITKALNYSDLIFYQCLFYIDSYFSHNFTEDYQEKKLLYYLVGFFLITSKMKENDIFEPTFDTFRCIKKNITLHEEKIGLYEIKCLKIIKYNIFAYSTYDWIYMLIALGFVFDSEIDSMNEHDAHKLIKSIYKSVMKILINITTKNIFIKYSPMYKSLSIIQIVREKYLKEHNNNSLFISYLNLFDINIKDYQQCYTEIKEEINPTNSNNTHEKMESEQIQSTVLQNNVICDEDKKETTNEKNNKFKSSKIINCVDTRKNKSHLVILCNKAPNFSNQNLPNLVPLYNENNENKNEKNSLFMPKNLDSPKNENENKNNQQNMQQKGHSTHKNKFKEDIKNKTLSKKNQSVGIGPYKMQKNSDKAIVRNNFQSSNLLEYYDSHNFNDYIAKSKFGSNKKIKIDASANNLLNSQSASNKKESDNPVKIKERANSRITKKKSKFLNSGSKNNTAGKSAMKSSNHVSKVSNFDVNAINNITFND